MTFTLTWTRWTMRFLKHYHQSMLSLVSPKLNKTLSAAIIGNIVTSEITHEATGKFKKSAAHASYTDTSVQGISHAGIDLIQIIADNFNADILVSPSPMVSCLPTHSQ